MMDVHSPCINKPGAKVLNNRTLDRPWQLLTHHGLSGGTTCRRCSPKQRVPKIQLAHLFWKKCPVCGLTSTHLAIVALLFCRTFKTDNWQLATSVHVIYTLELCTHSDVESHKNTPQMWFEHYYRLLLAFLTAATKVQTANFKKTPGSFVRGIRFAQPETSFLPGLHVCRHPTKRPFSSLT
jgi:hypothetical protein